MRKLHLEECESAPILGRGIRGFQMYLGIDVGTSAVKAVIVGEDGILVEQASATLSVDRPAPRHSEQDPENWWLATCSAVLSLSKHARSGVRAIGLSGQMHGATLLGVSDEVLRPAILWNDGRSDAECDELAGDVPNLATVTGNRAMPGFTAPKILWIRKHEPTVFSQVAKVLLPKDFIRLKMSGDYASDVSDAAGTLWLNTLERDWSDTSLAACGLSRHQMPALFEGNEFTGSLSSEVAADWGMGRVPIAAGGGDNAAGAVGGGAVAVGDAFISLGTSGVIFHADDQFRPNTDRAVHTFCHALPGLWHQMSVTLCAASAIDWVASVTGFDSPADIYAAAEHRGEPATTEVFLPYLAGERTPHNDPHALGAFFGLTSSTDSASLAQAALEGVAFSFVDGLEALQGAGVRIDKLDVIGGGSRSSYWGRILSAALGVPLVYRESGAVGPAFGAARLAMIAETSQSIQDVCMRPPEIETISPDPMLQQVYCEKIKHFRTLYRQTSPTMREISK